MERNHPLIQKTYTLTVKTIAFAEQMVADAPEHRFAAERLMQSVSRMGELVRRARLQPRLKALETATQARDAADAAQFYLHVLNDISPILPETLSEFNTELSSIIHLMIGYLQHLRDPGRRRAARQAEPDPDTDPVDDPTDGSEEDAAETEEG